MALFVLSFCPFDISVDVGAYVIGLSDISSFFSYIRTYELMFSKFEFKCQWWQNLYFSLIPRLIQLDISLRTCLEHYKKRNKNVGFFVFSIQVSFIYSWLFFHIWFYKKRLLLRCIHHFKSDLMNNMDHMRISGNEPLSVIFRQTKWFVKQSVVSKSHLKMCT